MLLHFTATKPVATVEELAEAAGTTTANAYRYLSLLRETSLVEERQRGGYALSPRVHSLARAASASQNLLETALPVMQALGERTGESVILIQRIRDTAVCSASSISNRAVRLSYSPGDFFPLHLGAGPKLLLANMNAKQRDTYLGRLTELISIEQRAKLESDLMSIQKDDYAVSDGEIDPDVWANAAPIRSSGRVVVATVSMAAPRYRVDESGRENMKRLVIEAAEEISSLLN
jgi:DNA-binding IclR family transcriptional regulator